jgi:hypothetical protein
VNDGVRKNEDPARHYAQGEEGVSPELLRVRSLLLSLPKVGCRPGFEFRLQKSIGGVAGGTERSYSSSRNWMLGWAGVGLGVATALVVAVVAFDFHFQNGGRIAVGGAPVVSGSASHFSVPQGVVGTPVSAENTAQVQEKCPDPQSEQLAQKEPDKLAAKKDTTPARAPSPLPENLYHQASGNGR